MPAPVRVLLLVHRQQRHRMRRQGDPCGDWDLDGITTPKWAKPYAKTIWCWLDGGDVDDVDTSWGPPDDTGLPPDPDPDWRNAGCH